MAAYSILFSVYAGAFLLEGSMSIWWSVIGETCMITTFRMISGSPS